MPPAASPTLFDFHSARPALPVFCHLEFLEQLERERQATTAKRASLLIQRMLVDPGRLHYKATHGVNRGWRRSRLGGNHGSHFYAWWTSRMGAPLQAESSFASAPEGALFLRAIRHHDDHSPLPPSRLDDYLPVTVPESRLNTYAPAPWTSTQSRFLKSPGVAKVLKGHPGSGKTTALLSAADATNAPHVLYVTFSPDLAALARDYFDRYCAADRTFTVLTFPMLLRQLLKSDVPPANTAECRARFRRDLAQLQRNLGAWAADVDALYDETFAHLLGAALPENVARFPQAREGRLPDSAYRQQRDRYLGPPAAGLVLDTAKRLSARGGPQAFAETYFPDLALAAQCAAALQSHPPAINPAFLSYNCIAVDECQDLTPLESYVVIALARTLNKRGFCPLLLAGDEAQTVRPTDFEWAWLHDLLHHVLSTPQEFKLSVNLRSPKRIAGLVNRVWDLYENLDKKDRPSGSGYADIEDDSPDQVIYCTAPSGDPLRTFLHDLVHREGYALITFDPEALAPDLRPLTLTPLEAKGLDFQTVAVLNAGRQLRTIYSGRDNTTPVDTLRRRLAIDQLRVALSRPSERLIWIDVQPTVQNVLEAAHFLREADRLDVPPITIEALRQSFAEEELDLDERVQRCRHDALQLIEVKPDLAWSRAQQACMLARTAAGPLPDPWRDPDQIDAAVSTSLYGTAAATLAEVCCRLALRKAKLSPELGRRDLFREASDAARQSGAWQSAIVIHRLAIADELLGKPDRLNAVTSLMQGIVDYAGALPAWLSVELTARADSWIREIEPHLTVGHNAVLAAKLLPPFFEALQLPGREARTQTLLSRCTDLLLKEKKYQLTLELLETARLSRPEIEAQCYEALEDFPRAAKLYHQLGNQEKRLACLRAVADFDGALEVVRQLKTHPARESLEWLKQLQSVIDKRPDNFNRVMTAPEKKLLETTMERALGVARKKPAAKKATAGTKTTAAKKTARKTAAKKPF